MPFDDRQSSDLFAVGRLVNLQNAAEGSLLPPEQVGEFRVPFVTNLRLVRTQSFSGQTLFTLAWDDAVAETAQIDRYNIYVLGLLGNNQQPLGPQSAKQSPAPILVQSDVATHVTLIVQTQLKNGLVSELSRSPSVSGVTIAPQLTAADFAAGAFTGVSNEIDVTNTGTTVQIGIVDPLIVGKGGTGAATFTSNALLKGNGTGAIAAQALGTANQVLGMNAGATDEEFKTLTAGANISIGHTPNTVTISATGVAASSEPFVTIGNTAGLSAERALTGTSNQIIVTDNGANSTVVISTPQNIDTGATVQFGSVGLGIAVSGNGRAQIKAGNQTTLVAKAGGRIDQNTTQTGNTAATETDLFTTTIKANTLNTNGDGLEFFSAGTFGSTASTDKRVRAYFNTTLIFDTGNLNLTSASWTLHGFLIRTGASAYKAGVFFDSSSATLLASALYTSGGDSLTADEVLKVTGSGTNANDTVGEMWRVTWESAA